MVFSVVNLVCHAMYILPSIPGEIRAGLYLLHLVALAGQNSLMAHMFMPTTVSATQASFVLAPFSRNVQPTSGASRRTPPQPLCQTEMGGKVVAAGERSTEVAAEDSPGGVSHVNSGVEIEIVA